MATSLTAEEKAAWLGDIITYAEYCESIEGTKFSAEEIELKNKSTPSWFHEVQEMALDLFTRCVPQVQCLPRNRDDFEDLKTKMWIEQLTNIAHVEPMDYKRLYQDALSWQMWFIKENEWAFENGWINGTTNFSVASYAQGGQSPVDYRKVINDLYPKAKMKLHRMGWMNMCINHPIDSEDFYKGEK